MTGATTLLGAFLSPALFWGGSAAVAAPILIHLLARRRFKRIRWAAMELLIHAERRNRRRIRMEEWILLALRCLAVLLIALMIGRPFIKPVGAGALLGGSHRTERVFVLDDSLSMTYESPEGTPFALAKQAVRRLLGPIRSESPDDTVTLLRMSDPTAPIESGTYLDREQTEDLLTRLDAMNPSQRAIDPARVIESVVGVLEQSPDVTSAAVYLISDFQRHDWSGRGRGMASTGATIPEAGVSGILGPLDAWAGEDRGLHLVLINVGVDEAQNLSLTELELTGGQLVAGATGTARVGVANFGDRARDNVELVVSVGNLDQPSHSLRELVGGQHTTVDLDVEFLRSGFEGVRVELPPDALEGDNVRHATVEVASAIRVLIVDGEASTDNFDDEVTFLTTALRPEGEVYSGNETHVIDEAQLEEVNLSGYHVVMLANVYRISEPAVEALEPFVRQGGGLLIFLGDQVDADLYNAALYRGGEGLLPGELTQIVRAAEASHLVIMDRLHPALRGLSGEGDPLGIGQIAFFEYFGCVPFGSTDGLIDPDSELLDDASAALGDDDPRHRAAARVIARFDDADEHPAIVERVFGRGHVTLVTTTADKEWHHWPDHPTYLPVMMELVRHSSTRSSTSDEVWVGETVEFPLDPARYEPDAIVRTPGYPDEREIGITAIPGDDGRGLALTWDHTEVAGLYEFLLKRREGGEVTRLVAVNVDPLEGDLTMASEDELRRAMKETPFQYYKGIDGLTGATGEARVELWRFVLIGAFLVLMTEQFLAWSWGRRK